MRIKIAIVVGNKIYWARPFRLNAFVALGHVSIRNFIPKDYTILFL